MHSVIQYGDDGAVLSVSKCATEDMVNGKLAAMAKAGQKAVALYWAQPTIDITLLVWDVEQKRLTKRRETLAELRAPLLARLKEFHGQAAMGDVTLGAGQAQGDFRAQHVVQTFALRIRAGEKNPHGGIWRLKDNSEIACSDDDVLALDAAFTGRNADCQRRAWKIADAIRALDTPAALKAFNISQAWATASDEE